MLRYIRLSVTTLGQLQLRHSTISGHCFVIVMSSLPGPNRFNGVTGLMQAAQGSGKQEYSC